MKRNLNELDITRIVRRVLNEGSEDCFEKYGVKMPEACKPSLSSSSIGSGMSVSRECLSEVSEMITYSNFLKIGQLLTCLGEDVGTSKY